MLQTTLLKDPTMPAPGPATRLCRSLWLLVLCLPLGLSLGLYASKAAALTIMVLDNQGEPFEGAVVELQHPSLTPAANPAQASMDQVNKQFKPHVLAVQQGTPVVFPNSDSIKHHVYSFSAAKRFQLKLYKEQQPDPLIFDKPGIVALGCNVHDWMVGYIYVSRSPQFSRTDEKGQAHFEVPDGSYQLQVWHPRFQTDDVSRQKQVEGSTGGVQVYQLQHPLHPKLNNEADEFDVY
ncbi:methylamine utilization protein [Pseudomaricurvus alkylphenolicus]|uniref:methylamine utilization protein n=1 Tax=Pseudomaricurvus alkylphenolicus TaxID=1306991 RepID=UPI001421C141|nr:methylamine utilization protein [Pseudomaricurvus alkylphenolicus]NIB39590.1 methylamine utilization protein [Pseudomaricurvus alkylphenolicus]